MERTFRSIKERRCIRCKANAASVQATKQVQPDNAEAADVDEKASESKHSRSGRPIEKPARFLHLKSSEDESQKEGEVVRVKENESREMGHVRTTLQEEDV